MTIFENKIGNKQNFHMITFALTKGSSSRYANSAIPSMIRMLNDYELKKAKVLQTISDCAIPMNYDSSMSYHCGNKI
jgi:hypothetical protein